MPGTYKTRGWESWSTIARQTTGNDIDASSIKRSNPAYHEPLPKDVTIQIPKDSYSSMQGTGVDLEIFVDDTNILTFSEFEISMAVDAITKGFFVVPNEPETRYIFAPLSSPRITVQYEGEVICTGRCLSPIPNNTPSEKSLHVGFYASPGILETCTPSIEKFPLEWKDTLLEQIAEDLCNEHGVSVESHTPTSSRFKRVDIQPGDTVLNFLSGLASQRGLILSSTPSGSLFVHSGSGSNEVVSFLESGKHPTETIGLVINEERFFSSLTGIVPASRRKKGSKFTVHNPNSNGIIRAHTFSCADIEPGELETAVKSAAGRMFAESCTVDVEVATWQNDLGSTYIPGQTVKVQSEEDFIIDPFVFFVTGVNLYASAGRKSAQLHLSFPGVYSGEIPERLPWF